MQYSIMYVKCYGESLITHNASLLEDLCLEFWSIKMQVYFGDIKARLFLNQH